MIIQRKFKKLFTYIFILILIIGILPLISSEKVEISKDFGEEIYLKLKPYLDSNSIDSSFQIGGATITNAKKYVEINFMSEDVYPEDLDFLYNIKSSVESKNNSYILINKSNKKIYQADFSIYEKQYFIFGNNYFLLPENSRVIFKNGIIELLMDDGTNLSNSLLFLDENLLSNAYEIKGNNIEISNDLILREGEMKIIPEGYFIEYGNVIYNKKNIFVESKNDQVLISKFNLKNYRGNWIYETSNNLEIHSSDFGYIKMQFLEDNNLINVEKEDLLLIQVENGDSLEISKFEGLNSVPEFKHIYSELGKTKITNGNLGTFVYSKDDLIIEKNLLSFGSLDYGFLKPGEVEMYISSDSPLISLEVEVNNYGEVSMFDGNRVINTFNKNLSERLEGFSYNSLKRTYGDNWGNTLNDSILYFMEVGSFNYKQANEISESLDEYVASDLFIKRYGNHYDFYKKDRLKYLDKDYFDYLAFHGLTSDQSVNLTSLILKNGGKGIVSIDEALESAARAKLSSNQSFDLISKILVKSFAANNNSNYEYLDSECLVAFSKMLNRDISPEYTYSVISLILNESPWQILDLSSSFYGDVLPYSINNNLTEEESLSFFSKILDLSKENDDPFIYIDYIDYVLDEGLTEEESLSLMSEINQISKNKNAIYFNKVLSISLENNLSVQQSLEIVDSVFSTNSKNFNSLSLISYNNYLALVKESELNHQETLDLSKSVVSQSSSYSLNNAFGVGVLESIKVGEKKGYSKKEVLEIISFSNTNLNSNEKEIKNTFLRYANPFLDSKNLAGQIYSSSYNAKYLSEFDNLKNKYGVKPINCLHDISINLDYQEDVVNAAKESGINPYLLYSSLEQEGMISYLNNNFYSSNKKIDNYNDVGADALFNELDTLKQKGYLKSDLEYNKDTLFPATNEANYEILVGQLTSRDAIRGVSAMLKAREDDFLRDAKLNGVNTNSLSQDQIDWWTYAYYNLGSSKAKNYLDKYGVNFIYSKNDEDLREVASRKSSVHFNAGRVAGSSELLRDLEIFEKYY